MLVKAASLQHVPSVETVLLSRSQVCVRKPRPSCSFTHCLCRSIDPFALCAYWVPSLSRAELLTQRCQSQSTSSSQKFHCERSFYKGTRRYDLQSLHEALKENLLDDALQSYNESPSKDSQRWKAPLQPVAKAQPNTDVLEQQRVPTAETVQNSSARNQPDTQSSATSSGSRQPRSTITPKRTNGARPLKRRSRRISSGGLDVLDKLMASQGHTSRSLLESLQSTVASDDNFLSRGKDILKVRSEDIASDSLIGQASGNQIVERTQSQMRPNFNKRDTWKPTYDTTIDNASKRSAFASSIEKVLSPSTAPKSSSTTRSTRASSAKGHELEQNTATSSSEAYTADVAKPSLQGEDVLLALQKAAIEKAKLKQRSRRVSNKASKSKGVALSHDTGEWRDAKPIVVKPAWAHQIDELEHRIENLKNPLSPS